MAGTQPKPKVRGGIPWYLWLLIVPLAVAVVAGVILSQVPQDPEELYQKARELASSRESEKLKNILVKLEKIPGYESKISLVRGLEAAAKSRDPRAIEFFERAAEDESLAVEALRRLGNSHRNIGNLDKATAAYKKSLALDPENIETQMTVAELYFGLGSVTPCLELLDRIIEKQPDHSHARQLRAQQKIDLHDYEGALEDFDELLKTPGDRAAATPEMLKGYLLTLMKVGDIEKLTSARDEFLDLVSDSMFTFQVQVRTGIYDPLRAEIAHSAEMEDESMRPPMERFTAEIALAEGDISTASKDVKKAMRQYPRDAEIFRLAAKIFAKSNEQEWQKAAEANVDALEEMETSLIEAMKAVGADYDDAESRLRVADQLLQLGRGTESLRWHAIARTIDPESGALSMTKVFQQLAALKPLVPLPDEEEVQQTQNDANANTEPETKPETPDSADSEKPAQQSDASAAEKSGDQEQLNGADGPSKPNSSESDASSDTDGSNKADGDAETSPTAPAEGKSPDQSADDAAGAKSSDGSTTSES